VKSIGSDPGHCLASGIIDTSLAEKFVKRFVAPDLFSGWGIRTLSAEHPSFNPFSYHRGSVWPVENGVFPLATVRFGLYREAEMLCRSLFETAALFDYYRLPEVFSGHQRDQQHPFPAVYPRADWPQAWSASSLFCALQGLLGLYPYAPLKTLVVNPHLPGWLPEVILRGLRVGAARATIRFFRKPDGSSDYEILDKRGTLHVIQQPSPWSQTDGWVERTRELIHSMLPGR
jgi:glycogen debranching enzyme